MISRYKVRQFVSCWTLLPLGCLKKQLHYFSCQTESLYRYSRRCVCMKRWWFHDLNIKQEKRLTTHRAILRFAIHLSSRRTDIIRLLVTNASSRVELRPETKTIQRRRRRSREVEPIKTAAALRCHSCCSPSCSSSNKFSLSFSRRPFYISTRAPSCTRTVRRRERPLLSICCFLYFGS